MGITSLWIVQILASVFLAPQDFVYETPTYQNPQTLVRGVSEKSAEKWIAFLLEGEVSFSLKRAGGEIRVSVDPIHILQEAEKVPELREEAKQALSERTLEAKIERLWPEVRRASVCIARDTEDPGEPAIFIVAQGFPSEEKGRLMELVAEVTGTRNTDKALIMGSIAGRKRDSGISGETRPIAIAQR